MADGARTVLVVDDEEDIRDLLQMILTDAGYRVILAADGRQAQQQLARVHPHLIILDMNMPGQGGIAFYHDAVANRVDGHPKYPVLIFTGRHELKDVFKSFHVDGFMAKPFDIDELLREVDRIMAEHYDKERAGKSPRRAAFTVLVAEEQDNCFDVIAQALTAEGFRVEREKCLDDLPFSVKHLKPDLVLLKVGSPSLNGPELLVAARLPSETWPCMIPVVAYTYGVLEVDQHTLNTILNSTGVRTLLASVRPEALLEQARRYALLKKRSDRAV